MRGLDVIAAGLFSAAASVAVAVAEPEARETGVRIEQQGSVRPISANGTGGAAYPVQQVTLANGAFSLIFPGFDCPGMEDQVNLRFVPPDVLPEVQAVAEQSLEMADEGARNRLLFPFGSAMALPVGPAAEMMMTHGAPDVVDWPFVHVTGARFAWQQADMAIVTVAVIYETWGGVNRLANGAPFVMMVSRPVCGDAAEPRLALDVITVRFAGS